jgi:hypothetical protein
MDAAYKIESFFVMIRFCSVEGFTMLSFIQRIVTRAHTHHASSVSSSVALGRWGIQYDPKIIQIKIDQANEDHCGCCVSSTTPVSSATLDSVMKTRYEKREEYLLPYVV